MLKMASEHYPNEVGTPLVGYYSDDGSTAHITSIGPLPPDSRSARFTFVRGIIGLSDFFKSLGKRFRGQRYRVGEWHTHPNGMPKPSGTDNRNQLALANDHREALPEAILIIIGGNPIETPSLGVFVYSRKTGRIDLAPGEGGGQTPKP
jgi:proteasome lid subunit RPN8/RPN11